eukprot:202012_1
MAQKSTSNKKKEAYNEMYITKFRFAKPKGDDAKQDSFKEIRIYDDNGPIETPDGHIIEFDWYNHSHGPYEEDIFTLLDLNLLPEIHEYCWVRFGKSANLGAKVLRLSVLETDVRYGVGDVVSKGTKCYGVTAVAVGDALRYLPAYRGTLKLYDTKQINLAKSIKKEKIKFKNDIIHRFGNIEDLSMVTTGRNGKYRGKKAA